MVEEKGNNPQTIGENFEAKEAISKYLGLDIRGYNFKDIDILRNNLGKPIVKIYNNLKQICIQYSVLQIKESIYHSENYAVVNAITITS
ncbi:4'-phosphopantetheinyl transferase superfamily protein [Terrisporobacter petrolearius]|uniref:4'-phosphopantetheinyl transferase superfamily protein n=1 Tax=Terrisporobacter petrolearius TaxID=1460447 RepID=UPI003B008E17